MLERVEGRPYPEVVRTRILDPLEMSATEPAITHEMRERLAVGYEYLHDDRLGYPGAPLAPATWLETETADGSIASTASDMCAFARLLLNEGVGPSGRLLSADAFKRMATEQIRADETYAYGYGLAIRGLHGRRLIGHGGGMVGYLAGLQIDPEAGLGAVVLQNGMSANPMTLARELLRLAREARDDGSPPVTDEGSAAATYDELAGVFVPVESGVPFELVGSGDGLELRAGGRMLLLEELDTDIFLVPDAASDRFALRVERPVPGAVELWHGDRRYVREGAVPHALDKPTDELRAIAGQYRSHNPWTTNFSVVLRGARPWLVFPAAPDGFEDEQPLVRSPDGTFRAGEDPGNPEGVRFDTIVEGQALRAWLSGCPYYRADNPTLPEAA